MIQVKNIKELNISLKELYTAKKQVNIHVKNSPYIFSLVLLTRNKIDCKISSFGANLWFRTHKGLNYQKYKSLATLQTAVKKAVKQKFSDQEITFSLSEEVYTF